MRSKGLRNLLRSSTCCQGSIFKDIKTDATQKPETCTFDDLRIIKYQSLKIKHDETQNVHPFFGCSHIQFPTTFPAQLD